MDSMDSFYNRNSNHRNFMNYEIQVVYMNDRNSYERSKTVHYKTPTGATSIYAGSIQKLTKEGTHALITMRMKSGEDWVLLKADKINF